MSGERETLTAARILVCGSRDFNDPFRASLTIDARIGLLEGECEVLHGAARGADLMAADAAFRRGHNVRAFPARWEEHGRRAGFIRNLAMLDERPDLVIAFWNGESKGTAHTIREARKRGIPVEVIQP